MLKSKPKRYITLRLITFVLLLVLVANAQNTAKKSIDDSIQLPNELKEILAAAKKQNNLSTWLNKLNLFIYENPQDRYSTYGYIRKNIWREPNTADRLECLDYFDYLTNNAYDALEVKGWIPESVAYYEKADSFYTKHHTKIKYDQEHYVSYLLRPLSNCYTMLGDYNNALLIHRKVLQYALKAKDSSLAASTYGNMAVSYRWCDSLPQAFNAAFSGKRINYDTTNYFSAFLNGILGELYFLSKKNDSAYFFNEQSLHGYNGLLKNLNKLDEARIANGLSNCYQLQAQINEAGGKLAVAKNTYQQALQTLNRFFPNALNREKAKIFNKLAQLNFQTNNNAAAISCYNQCLGLLLPGFNAGKYYPDAESLIEENTIVEAISGKADIALKEKKTSLALEGMLLASKLEMRLRLLYLNSQSKFSNVVYSRRRTDDILQIAVPLYQKTKDDALAKNILEQVERSKAQVLFEEWSKSSDTGAVKNSEVNLRRNKIIEQLKYYREIKNESNTVDNTLDNNIKELEYQLSILERNANQGVQNKLFNAFDGEADNWLSNINEQSILLNYFVGDSSIFLITIAKNKIENVENIADAKAIKSSVSGYLDKYFYNGPSAMQAGPQGFKEMSHKIFQLLIPPIDFEKYDNLVLMPDEVLYQLPFDALAVERIAKDAGDWVYLCSKIPIGYAFSLSLYVHQKLAVSNTNQHKRKTDIVGYFISKFNNKYPDLQEVSEEYKHLSKKWMRRAVKNRQATKHMFQQNLQSKKILHLSTHNVMHKNQAALVFYDSLFYDWELKYLPVNIKLLVLNTCKGATGYLQKGEGIMSMSRFFTAAGANSIIAALWNINDESGTEFMKTFYEQLYNLKNPLAALHKTKMRWLEKYKSNTPQSLPYYWAGMAFIGVNQEIDIRTKPVFEQYLLLIALLILVPIALYYFYKKGLQGKS